jgi:hypothetical protein
VSYSERVRQALRELILRAQSAGRGPECLAAVQEIDRRIAIYPQFGQPLRDLPQLAVQIWLGVVPPLVVRYAIDEEKRLVLVGEPIQSLPGSGF